MVDKLIRSILNPGRIPLKVWKRYPVGSFKLRLDYDIFERPPYAYCVYHAARLANALNIRKISVVEFGVAGGNGLVNLENLGRQVEGEVGPEIEIYGFDRGSGLPNPVDYRDLPYIWMAGFYKMDMARLQRVLVRSQLVLGDIADTVGSFFENYSPAPLGAVFFDLDFYSSTRDALKIFDGANAKMLPRVYCYCDDVISSDNGLLSDSVGQLLAIREYNESHPNRNLAPIAGFRHTRSVPAQWNDQIYIHHSFDHPDYNTYVHPDKDRQLPLRGSVHCSGGL
jgi:hypothetical protein